MANAFLMAWGHSGAWLDSCTASVEGNRLQTTHQPQLSVFPLIFILELFARNNQPQEEGIFFPPNQWTCSQFMRLQRWCQPGLTSWTWYLTFTELGYESLGVEFRPRCGFVCGWQTFGDRILSAFSGSSTAFDTLRFNGISLFAGGPPCSKTDWKMPRGLVEPPCTSSQEPIVMLSEIWWIIC